MTEIKSGSRCPGCRLLDRWPGNPVPFTARTAGSEPGYLEEYRGQFPALLLDKRRLGRVALGDRVP